MKQGIRVWAFIFSALCISSGCHRGQTGVSGGDSGGTNDSSILSGLTITPNPAQLEVTAGGPPATQAFTARITNTGEDVTTQASWNLSDGTIGSMSGNTFTSVVTRGGTTSVNAGYSGEGTSGFITGSVSLTLRFRARVSGGCKDCPSFPGDDAPVCTGANAAPTLVYPPDGVLLPPNMTVMEVHFMPGQGNDLFEVAFKNAFTDVRVLARCTAITNSRKIATGGCAYQLDPTVWKYLVETNRSGDGVNVSVRAAPPGGACASPSSERRILFASEDIKGGLYYWQSAVYGGVAGKTGGIYRYDFGVPAATGEAYMTPGQTNTCVGCHTLSRDGKRMTYGWDDADADDEYLDMWLKVLDVETKTVLNKKTIQPGLVTFSPDHTRFLTPVSSCNTKKLLNWNGDTGDAVGALTFTSLSTSCIAHPDWTKDGKTVYFVIPAAMYDWSGHTEDKHFGQGSIYKIDYDPAKTTYDAPTPVITSAGPDENNYYPSVSPDGRFLVFNRAVGTGLTGHDAYNNANARLWALFLAKSNVQPIDMQRANQGNGLTNSWPRWSPFIQTYKGKPLLWVTFSSTRDYGLRVQNSDGKGTTLPNCYPPESPEDPTGSRSTSFDKCAQPQIWMAAVALSEIEFSANDPSYPAFWLPFQDVTSHNHAAQWTEVVVGGKDCGKLGDACSDSQPCCTGFICDTTGHCVLKIN